MASQLVSASFWAIAGSASQYVAVFFLLVYLAHSLSPHDFGLMATVTVFLDLGMQIARWGQLELLQQPRYRNDEARNQSLRLSLAIACVFAALFVIGAEPIGRMYRSRQLPQMMYICAAVFPFYAAGSIAEAILRSEFRFRLLAFRNTVVTVIGAGVAILLASHGFGALTLAIQRLAQVSMASLWVWTAVTWKPRLTGRVAWSSALVRDGASVMFGTVLPLLVPRTVDLLVGFTLGPSQLGLMRVAYRINDFVSQMLVLPLVQVANAQLSSLSADLESMRRAYLRLTQASAAMMCPVLIGLALVANEAVPLMFGEKWRPCVPLVQIVSLVALVAPVNLYFSSAMVALGHTKLVLRQGLFQLVVGITLAMIASRISLQAIVIAHVVRATLVCIFNIFDLRRRMQSSLRDLWHFMAAPYISTLIMAAGVGSARLLLAGSVTPLVMLVALTAVGGASYAASLWFGGRLRLWPSHASLFDALLPRRWRPRATTGAP
jgi:O-antigen/teichoic acid export membrane protein